MTYSADEAYKTALHIKEVKGTGPVVKAQVSKCAHFDFANRIVSEIRFAQLLFIDL